jgi:peroxiredoxin
MAGHAFGALLAITAVALIGGTAWNLRSVEVPSAVAMPTGVALEAGATAPDLQLERVGGDSLALADLRGKVVVATFWATWSESSRQQLRALQKLQAGYANQDVVIIALNLDREREGVAQDVEQLGLHIPVLFATVADQLRYRASVIPTLYVIDGAGKIRHQHTGFLPGVEATLTRQIDALLGATSGQRTMD